MTLVDNKLLENVCVGGYWGLLGARASNNYAEYV